jgi:hypothetical protein
VRDEPTILLGVGATKAGTTWLYNHLRDHPDCHIRAIKELHYFDTVEDGSWQRQIKLTRRLLDKMAERRARGTARADVSLRRQGDVREWIGVLKERAENVPGYLAYLGNGRGERNLVADITPSYALLPEARLRTMAGMAADVRFLYLLRDPVSRLWSNLRMMAARAGAVAEGVQDAARAMLERILDGEGSGAVDRGDYAGAIRRLRAAVDPSRLMVAFQETVQTAPGLARLCAFLGIRTVEADFGVPVLAGVPAEMTPGQVVRLRAFLAPQYAFVAQEFSDLPAAWRRNMVEGVA